MSESAPLQGRAFLVVDDETFVRSLVARLLRGLGAWVVEEAADGATAVALLKSSEYQFDCVLTDFAMRPRNGLRLLADIRTGAEGLKRNQPVLMLTAHADAGLVWAAFQLDTNGFLVKPPTKASLAERLEKILSRPQPVKSAEAYRQIATVVAQAEGGDAPSPAVEPAPNTVNAGTLLTQDRARPGTAPAEPAASIPEFQVALDQVRDGAILSRNLLATGGGLLLANGTQLTGRLIERLRDLAEVDASIASLWVRASAE